MQPKVVITLPPDTADVDFTSAATIVAALQLTANQVRRGQLDTKIANAVGILAATALRACEGLEVDRKLRELREVLVLLEAQAEVPAA